MTETGVGKGLLKWTAAPVDLGLGVILAFDEAERESWSNMEPFSLGAAEEEGLPIRDVVGLLPVV